MFEANIEITWNLTLIMAPKSAIKLFYNVGKILTNKKRFKETILY